MLSESFVQHQHMLFIPVASLFCRWIYIYILRVHPSVFLSVYLCEHTGDEVKMNGSNVVVNKFTIHRLLAVSTVPRAASKPKLVEPLAP